jgi:hypothetical protein
MEVKQFARLLLNVIENQAAKPKGGNHEVTNSIVHPDHLPEVVNLKASPVVLFFIRCMSFKIRVTHYGGFLN